MIHVLDFDDNIIDYISKNDNYITQGTITRDNVEETDTFDFMVDSDRAYNLRERNRIIVQDRNNIYREYIIVNVSDDIDDQTTVQCNASYVEDLTTAKPYTPGGFTKYTTTQALDDITKDTGWETSEETEYGGVRSSSWTSYQTRYEVARQMRTTYDMVLDFSIELSSNSVAHRYVSLKDKQSLFKGKEIVYGKDLLSMTRTVDITEVHTALLAIGPEDEEGNRKEVIVTDDDAQVQFGLDKRYIWGVYEPESEDGDMTEARLTTLARTQLNKDKQAAISYEITSADLSKQYSHEEVNLGDTVRVKDTEFNPPLYIDAEVVSEEYDIINGESTFTFGNVKEYKADELRKDLYDRINDIQKKMNDNITNVNTIVGDVVAGQLEYFERKIIKSETPPENPVNDMMWYDTSNPEVAVLRRYWNGEWLEQTADDVEKIGGITREKALYSELTNTFTNLSIQHAKLQSDVYEVVSNEYLVDDDLRAAVNTAYNNTTKVFDNIKGNLDSMTPETATIGKLVDTQALFLTYRERMQTLYKAVENAKRAIDKRFKLLQSQYTDEKFNNAMEQIAATLPNGVWNVDTMQLSSDIPNQQQLEELRTSIQAYTDGNLSDLKDLLTQSIDSKINVAKNEISASVTSLQNEIDGLEIGSRNLLRSYTPEYNQLINTSILDTEEFIFEGWATELYSADYLKNILQEGKTYTLSYELEITELATSEMEYSKSHGLLFHVYGGDSSTSINTQKQLEREIGNKMVVKHTFTIETLYDYRLIAYTGRYTGDGTAYGEPVTFNEVKITNLKLEQGNIATDWTPAPEDNEYKIALAQQQATDAAKVYADAQDNLKAVETQAYADGIVDEVEQRAIDDATSKMNEAKTYAEQKATDAQNAAISESERLTQEAEQAAKSYADAQDELQQVEVRAYADGVVDAEEQRAIQDATEKMNTAKTYAETKATEAKNAAITDAANKLKPITTRVTTTESNIKVLQDGLKLTATKTEVEQTLNDKLTPIQNQVNEQKATLDVLPNQIASKVSQSEYTTDQNNIVSRLDSADSERVQLANQISDRVTLKEYTDGKEATTEEINNAVNNVQMGARNLLSDSLNINFSPNATGSGNAVQNEDKSWSVTSDVGKWISIYKFIKHTNVGINKLTEPLILNQSYVLSIDVTVDKDTQVDFYSSILKPEKETYQLKAGIKQRLILPFVYTNEIENIPIILLTKESDVVLTYDKFKLEKGNKATDWTPAPEDIQAQVAKAQADAETAAKAYADAQDNLRKTEAQAYADGVVDAEEQRAIQDATDKLNAAKTYAETKATTAQTAAQSYAKTQSDDALTKANAYTDNLKTETNQTLTTMQTSIDQNGQQIALKASTTEMNASKKTLSSVIADLTINTTTGITMSYDENGAISSHTVDKNGVKIRGDKVDIAVNKEFQVLTGNVDGKVGKDEVVNRLNLSPEGLDINVNKIGIHGGEKTVKYVDIRNDKIELGGNFTSVWRGATTTDPVYTRLQNGHLRIRNDSKNASLYYTFNGISTYADGEGESGGSSGTIAWWDPSYSPSGANGITINSYGGVAALTSGVNRTMVQSRASVNLESMRSAIYIRPHKSEVGNSTFAFTSSTGETNNANVKGYLMFGDLTNEDSWKYYSGLRFYKGKSYVEVVDGDFTAGGNTVLDAGNIMTNDIFKRNGSTTVYWNGTSSGTINDGKGAIDNQLAATSMVTNYGDKNMYLGTRSGGSLLITDEHGYNSGKGQSYSGVGAARFTNMSLESLKTDIQAWNYDALNVLVNETQIYQYKLKNDVENGGGFNNRGLVIGDGYETPDEFRAGDGINLYEMSSWQLRAIQQLNEKLEEQNETIKQLEAKVNE